MVADGAASRAVWRGERGALAGAARGTVLVECSTLTVAWIEELAREAASSGCELLDAPVTGSKTLAGRMTARDYRPNFLLPLMAKDLTYGVGEGRRHGVELSTAACALALYQRAIAHGRGEEDFSVIVEPLREAAPGPPTAGKDGRRP